MSPARWLVLSLLVVACSDDTSVTEDAGVDVSFDGPDSPRDTADAPSDTADAGPMESELMSALRRRFEGDRSGACVQAALIEGNDIERASFCAGQARDLQGAAFEIGSISKTMTAFLVHDLIARGELNLDDTLAERLGWDVVQWGDTPITIRHVLTHTSGLPGLPENFSSSNPANPFADTTAESLREALAVTTLASEPGTAHAYSNYAFMVLSHLVSTLNGGTFEEVVRRRLFARAQMDTAFVDEVPDGVRLLEGHFSNSSVTQNWTNGPTLGGVGMVRATLDDMVAYAQLVLGRGEASAVELMEAALEPLGLPASNDPKMASAWFIVEDGGTFHYHGGATGGFNSLIFVARNTNTAIVLLADTSFSGPGLGEIAGYVLGFNPTLSAPRVELDTPRDIAESLVGDYELASSPLSLVIVRDQLEVRSGFLRIELGYDSNGDFFTRGSEWDVLIRPVRLSDGTTTFDWIQEGEPFRATRR